MKDIAGRCPTPWGTAGADAGAASNWAPIIFELWARVPASMGSAAGCLHRANLGRVAVNASATYTAHATRRPSAARCTDETMA